MYCYVLVKYWYYPRTSLLHHPQYLMYCGELHFTLQLWEECDEEDEDTMLEELELSSSSQCGHGSGSDGDGDGDGDGDNGGNCTMVEEGKQLVQQIGHADMASEVPGEAMEGGALSKKELRKLKKQQKKGQ
jgi:hypothetical protein